MADKLEMVGARIPPNIGKIIRQFAKEADRPTSYIVRKLIEESPRVKAAVRDARKARQ